MNIIFCPRVTNVFARQKMPVFRVCNGRRNEWEISLYITWAETGKENVWICAGRTNGVCRIPMATGLIKYCVSGPCGLISERAEAAT